MRNKIIRTSIIVVIVAGSIGIYKYLADRYPSMKFWDWWKKFPVNVCTNINNTVEMSNHYCSQLFSDAIIDLLDEASLPHAVNDIEHAYIYNSYSSPYLLCQSISMDPFWYGNSISVSDLTGDDVPAPLKDIANNESSNSYYKVIYYPGDALILKNGLVVEYSLPDGSVRYENLSNPGQYLRKASDMSYVAEYEYNGETYFSYALEYDKMMTDSERGYRTGDFFTDRRYAGTVIVAKRVVITGEVISAGYDLVIVTDDLVNCNGKINTTPPERPAGKNNPASYDYGFGKKGYNAGDVLIVARNIKNPPEIIAQGGHGQKGPVTDVEPVAWRDTYFSEYKPYGCEWTEDIELNPESDGFPTCTYFSQICRRMIDALYYYDEGLSKGGIGGNGGKIAFITTKGYCSNYDVNNFGGDPGENGALMPHFYPMEYEEISDWGNVDADVYMDFFDRTGIWPPRSFTGDDCERYCNAEYNASTDEWTAVDCLPNFEINDYTEPLLSSAGNNGIAETYWLDTDKRFNEYHTDGSITNHDFKVAPVVEPGNEILISVSDFAKIVDKIAPRFSDLLLARANALFNSLSYKDIITNDASYVADEELNPQARNRITEALHTYGSVLFFAANEMGGNGSIDNYTGQNPLWVSVQSAWRNYLALDAGYNYLGLRQPFFLYRKPGQIAPFIEAMYPSVEASRQLVVAAVENLAAGMAIESTTDADIDEIQGEITILDLEIEETVNAIEARNEVSNAIITTMEEIDQEISGYYGSESIASFCDSCGYKNAPQPCSNSTILNELEIISYCSDLKPCDFGCVFEQIGQFFESIGTIVNGIKSLYASSGMSLEGWGNLAKGIGGIAKGIIDIADMVDEAEAHAEFMNRFKYMTDSLAMGVQTQLTTLYQLRFSILNAPDEFVNPDEALAHIESYLDLLDKVNGANETLRQLRLDLLSETADICELTLHKSRLEAEKGLAQKRISEIAEQLQEAAGTVNQNLCKAQARVDYVMQSSSKVFDNYAMIKGLYNASVAFLNLDENGGEVKRTWNLLSQQGWADAQVENSDMVLEQVVTEILNNQGSFGAVFDIIYPLQYAFSQTTGSDGSTVWTWQERSSQEILDAICPSGTCQFTKDVYNEQKWQELRATSRMSFEFYPEGNPQFDALSQSLRNQWNGSFYLKDLGSEKQFRKRVYGIGIELILDNYTAPNPNFEFSIQVRHGERAEFQLTDGVYKTFLFPPDAHSSIIGIIRAAHPALSFPSVTTGDSFVETFDQVSNILDPDLTGLNSIMLRNNNMFGTSIRGVWEIDVSGTIDLLEQYGQAEVDRFWDKLKGIKFVVHYVPL